MTEQEQQTSPPVEQAEEQFTVTFRNGALTRIKKVARDLAIPEDRLSDVLIKAITLVDLAKEGTVITVKKGKEEYVIDLRLL